MLNFDIGLIFLSPIIAFINGNLVQTLLIVEGRTLSLVVNFCVTWLCLIGNHTFFFKFDNGIHISSTLIS